MTIAKHTELKKRLVINGLHIPIEIIHIVKDYLYHSENTSPTIQRMKNIKLEICYLFTNRTNVKGNEEIEEGEVYEEEYWQFSMSIPVTKLSSQRINYNEIGDYWPLSKEYYFSGRNCKMCGQYKDMTNTSLYEFTRGLTSQNMCKCII